MRLRFCDFVLDTDKREVTAGDDPVPVSPKNFEVLVYLIEHRDRMVPKSELMEVFWSTNTSDAALQKAISQLRRNLGAPQPEGSVIRTYHGRGFRFVAEAVTLDSRTDANAAPKPLLGETRSVTVICALLPAGQSGSAQAALDHAKHIVEQHDGRLVRTLIDGFVASFGNAPVFEDSARMASHCAFALAHSPANWRLGLDSGIIAFKEPSDETGWVLPGEIEQNAARLAQTAHPSEALLSDTVAGQIHDEFETSKRGDAIGLIAAGPMRTGIPARPRKIQSRFVGRGPDKMFLDTQLNLTGQQRGQTVTLLGPPGIGKSRMVSEFLSDLDASRFSHQLLQCLPGLQNTPYAPIGVLCRALFATPPQTVVRDDIDAALWRLMIGQNERQDAAHLDGLSDRRRQQRLRDVLLRALDTATQDRAMVLVFEDTHWLDPASEALLRTVLPALESKPLMILLTTRPVDVPLPTGQMLQLMPLSQADSAILLEEAAGGATLSPQQITSLVARADGNPFFIEELALTMSMGGDASTDVSLTVHAVIAARISALDVGLRQMLYVLAVLAPPADTQQIQALTHDSAQQIEQTADALVRMGFLRRQPDGFVFQHMLINDTAYAMIDPNDRRALHAQIAAVLEDSEQPQRPERLAWHHQEAGNSAAAIAYWTKASRAAIRQSAWTEAAKFAENGLALVSPHAAKADQLELDLLLCAAPALIALRGFPDPRVGQAYERASALNRKIGCDKAEIRVRVGQWINTWVRGRLDEALGHAEALVALSQRYPDPAFVSQGHASRGQVLMHMGELAGALEQLELGLAPLRDTPPATAQAQNSAVSCAAYASWVASMMGQEARALDLLDYSRQLATLRDNPYASAIHFALCSETWMYLGQIERCYDYGNSAVEISRENDFAFWLGTGLVMQGWSSGQLGRFDDAFDWIDEGIRVFAATGAGVQLANWHGLKSETQLRAGQVESALITAGDALNFADSVGDVYFTPRIYSAQAQALQTLGQTQAAETARQNAQARAQHFGLRALGSAKP